MPVEYSTFLRVEPVCAVVLERARHGDADGNHRAFGGLIVENCHDAHFVVTRLTANIEFLQPLRTRQHKEIRPDDAVIGLARIRLLFFVSNIRRGCTRFLAARHLDLDCPGGGRPFCPIDVGGYLREQFHRQSDARAGHRLADQLPADIVLKFLCGIAQRVAFLRIKYAGLTQRAVIFLEFLDGGHHPVADFTIDRAIIKADPCQIRLNRKPVRARHVVRGIGRRLKLRANGGRCHRLWLHRRGCRSQLCRCRLRHKPDKQRICEQRLHAHTLY